MLPADGAAGPLLLRDEGSGAGEGEGGGPDGA